MLCVRNKLRSRKINAAKSLRRNSRSPSGLSYFKTILKYENNSTYLFVVKHHVYPTPNTQLNHEQFWNCLTKNGRCSITLYKIKIKRYKCRQRNKVNLGKIRKKFSNDNGRILTFRVFRTSHSGVLFLLIP